MENLTINSITIDPEIKGGRAVFTGTRVPIDGLFIYLESGSTIDDFITDFPTVTKELVINVLEFAKGKIAS